MAERVRFLVDDRRRFLALRAVWEYLRSTKHSGDGLLHSERVFPMLPAEVQLRLEWTNSRPRPDYAVQLPERVASCEGIPKGRLYSWELDEILDSIESGEYQLLNCEMIDEQSAELTIEARAAPYGGLGGLFGLVEVFGFEVLGADWGSGYQQREDFDAPRERRKMENAKAWWRFW